MGARMVQFAGAAEQLATGQQLGAPVSAPPAAASSLVFLHPRLIGFPPNWRPKYPRAPIQPESGAASWAKPIWAR